MGDYNYNYNYAVIRELVTAVFDDEDLTIFCSDRFSEVAELFASGQTKRARVHLLTDCAKHQGLTEELLEGIRESNPYQYKKFEPRLKVSQLNSDRKKKERLSGSSDSPENSRTKLISVCLITTVSILITTAFAVMLMSVIPNFPKPGYEHVIHTLLALSLIHTTLSLTLLKIFRKAGILMSMLILIPLCMSLSVTSAAYWAGVSPNEIIRIIITLLTESEVPEFSDKPEHSQNEGLTPDTTGTGERMSEPEYRLRSKPEAISDDDVRDMIKKHNFYINRLPWSESRQWNNESGDFKHDFRDNGNGTVTDSVTGLVWEKAGSPNHMLFRDAQGYIQGLNKKKFAGCNDWRLPTLEELASLLENKEADDLFTDPLFDRKQRWYWSADKRASRGMGAWASISTSAA